MRVLFTGGGTAGHINPALAAASYLKKQNPNAEILFVGNKGGMEERLVPPAGYNIKCIKISGFQRKLTLKNIGRNFKTVARLASASVNSKKILKEFKPDVCVGTGGYVCGPVLREAAKMGIPCVVHESNAYPGVTIKLLAKKMHTVMLAVKAAEKFFDKDVNVQVTGNPVRPEIINADRCISRKNLGLDQRPLVLSVGGSLGAEKINQAIIPLLKRSIKDDKYQHIHSTGYGKITDELEAIKSTNPKNVKILEYVNMAECLAAADVVVSRAGAITITEIASKSRASVLIPSPNVSENHQFHNAMALVELGAAQIIEEKDLSPELLQEKIDEILQSNEKSQQMGEKANVIYKQDANQRIYNIILEASKANIRKS